MGKHRKNEYKIVDDYVIIYAKKRDGRIFEIFIDLENLDEVIFNFNYKWGARWEPHIDNYYGAATYYNYYGDGRSKTILMQNFIMKPLEDEVVDHIDHNPLNNRRSNLRNIKVQENCLHRKGGNKNNKSGYRNVSWLNGYKAWCVQLSIDGKNTLLGKFDDVHEAGKFAEEMREKYYGEFKGKS